MIKLSNFKYSFEIIQFGTFSQSKWTILIREKGVIESN